LFRSVRLERPLFSYTAPWTAAFLFDHLLQNGRIFRDGEVDARFRQEHRQIALSRSHVLRNDASRSSRLVGGIDFLDDSFSHLPGRAADIIPDSRHFRYLDGGYESTGFRFLKVDYVDRDAREEDVNLGRRTSLHAAFSPAHSGERAAFLLGATEGLGFEAGKRSFVLAQLSATTREPRHRNSILSFDARGVTRFHTRHPQAFVTRVRLDLGSQLDRDLQFYADGQNGLRAYPDWAFEGSRRWLVNGEYRLFLGRELFQLFAPSVAAFADSGMAGDGALSFRGRKSDVGIGLRIAISRYDGALIRIDYAYALDASPVNRRGGTISISTAHAF
ncbi:MAG: hypothetical protein JWO56_949, partial [Acidobacteria bacterium]|nr:hypothetical protein [Acidobacteriota bacterium]